MAAIAEIHGSSNNRSAIMWRTMPRRRQHRKPDHPLTRWRHAHRINQVPLAKATGMSQAMIAHIENYRHVPARENLEALLAYTGLPTDALIRGEQFLLDHPNFMYEILSPKPLPDLPPSAGETLPDPHTPGV
jgi:hypothetical protein